MDSLKWELISLRLMRLGFFWYTTQYLLSLGGSEPLVRVFSKISSLT